jgi:hypothetical protein
VNGCSAVAGLPVPGFTAKEPHAWEAFMATGKGSTLHKVTGEGSVLHKERPSPLNELTLQKACHECDCLLAHKRVWILHACCDLPEVRVHKQRVVHAHVRKRQQKIVAYSRLPAFGQLRDHERRCCRAQGLIDETDLAKGSPCMRLKWRWQIERCNGPAPAGKYDLRAQCRLLGCASRNVAKTMIQSTSCRHLSV